MASNGKEPFEIDVVLNSKIRESQLEAIIFVLSSIRVAKESNTMNVSLSQHWFNDCVQEVK